jgi:hypothetical protein
MYEGFVSMAPTRIDVVMEAPGDGCDCPRNGPVFGACVLYADAGDECSSGCRPCIDSIAIQSDGMEDMIETWDAFGIRTVRFHELAPGTEVTVVVSGCAGSFDLPLPVPTSAPFSVFAPEAVGVDQTRIRWDPSGSADEVAVGVGTGLAGAECRSADTGSQLVEMPRIEVISASAESRRITGEFESSNAHVVLFAAQRATWREM